MPVDGTVITVPPDVSQALAPDDDSDAEHESEFPPLTPLHGHVHGPFPDTVPAVPAVQRLVVGAVEKLPPLADPHTPSIGVGVLDDPIVIGADAGEASPLLSIT